MRFADLSQVPLAFAVLRWCRDDDRRAGVEGATASNEELLKVPGKRVVVLGLLFLNNLHRGTTEGQLVARMERAENLLQVSAGHRPILETGSD